MDGSFGENVGQISVPYLTLNESQLKVGFQSSELPAGCRCWGSESSTKGFYGENYLSLVFVFQLWCRFKKMSVIDVVLGCS